ncbi:hypothetical protein ASPBRDRAFT_175665 [Aspergillus brasiliensis CBS 101740]|uniref:Uncharacterized protein n=1 Tax=Aspergillus brasiliensis (strain CBS 101740 / IMI 381727 / IBT 21946) TaxID=767769 RepID=A0A1L9ULQ5_ASPBC|nr:hypothetical protein ASPBRDRAFT_175665 [Aspergillus brasiliensis CBS 101740]
MSWAKPIHADRRCEDDASNLNYMKPRLSGSTFLSHYYFMVRSLESKLLVIWFAVGYCLSTKRGMFSRRLGHPMASIGIVYLYPVLPLYGRSEGQTIPFPDGAA